MKKCKTKNKNLEIREELINQIYKDIIGGILNPLFFPVFEENNDLTVMEEDITYQIISSSNEQDIYNNDSSIYLGFL